MKRFFIAGATWVVVFLCLFHCFPVDLFPVLPLVLVLVLVDVMVVVVVVVTTVMVAIVPGGDDLAEGMLKSPPFPHREG